MRAKVLAARIATCFFLPLQGRAQITRGDVFLHECGPLPAGLDPGMKALMEGANRSRIPVCDMYILGILQGIDLYSMIAVEHSGKADPMNLGSVCVKDEVDADELKDIVVRYIQGHAEQQKFQTVLLALFAFEQAFPCAKPEQGSRPAPSQ